MIAYTSVGTNDWDRALDFYSRFFEPMKAKKLFASDRFATFGTGPGAPMFGVCKPYDGGDAEPGNGTMIALFCPDTEIVDQQYKLALELGGTDEGEPGQRAAGPFYMAYFRDLDGNKIALYAPLKLEG